MPWLLRCRLQTEQEGFGTLKSIGELRERSEDIKTDGGSIQETCREISIKSVAGITTMLERVWEFLSEEEERGIIGVYGPGRVGKTTLMYSMNNELITKGHQYDVLTWVIMSREFGECTIQQVVGARLGLSWDEKETGEHRALKQKQFLLLPDDIWEEIDLEKTVVPRHKCKVMFTYDTVYGIMQQHERGMQDKSGVSGEAIRMGALL